MSGARAKVLVVGPEQSGKSTIVNLLGGVNDFSSLSDKPYFPTQGLRIVEFEASLSNSQARNWGGRQSVDVELWDASGATKFESCWPAIQRDADGVLIVYNPENPNHSAEVETWFEFFVDKTQLSKEQVLVFANDRRSGPEDPQGPPPRKLRECELIFTDEGDTEKMKMAFEDLIATIGSFQVK